MTTTTRSLFALVLVAAWAGPAASQGPNHNWVAPPSPAASKTPAGVVMESLAVPNCRRHCDSLSTGVHTVDTVPVRLARQEQCSRKMVKG